MFFYFLIIGLVVYVFISLSLSYDSLNHLNLVDYSNLEIMVFLEN